MTAIVANDTTSSAGVPVGAPALVRPPPRAWCRLASMHARAFAREPSTRALCPCPGLSWAMLWMVALGMLAAGLGVATPDGRALGFLGPGRPGPARLTRIGALAGLWSAAVAALAWAGAKSPLAEAPWAFLAVALVATLALPGIASGLVGRRARARLRRARPQGWDHQVLGLCRARGEAGAGAELLVALCGAADERRATVVLEAGAPGLVAYYSRFGFEATGPSERLPGGAWVTPMARRPRGRRP